MVRTDNRSYLGSLPTHQPKFQTHCECINTATLHMAKKIMNAKFAGQCAETGIKIKKGERMVYDSDTKRCYAIASTTAINHINGNDEADNTGAMVQAQEGAYFDNFCHMNNI